MATYNEVIQAGIEKYTERKVKELKTFADPKVEGAFAIRASMEDGETIDFILVAHWQHEGRRLTPELVDKYLEEAMFESFPPPVGKPRFFL